MSTMRKQISLAVFLLGALVLLSLLVVSLQALPVVAGPLPIPTPIGDPVGGGEWVMVTYVYTDHSVDGDLHSSGFQTAAYSGGDFHWDIDVTAANQITCTLQWSNDPTNMTWVNGVELFDENADGAAMSQTYMFGRHSRITCTLNSDNPITVEIKAKLFN